jgi:hypothetical protein
MQESNRRNSQTKVSKFVRQSIFIFGKLTGYFWESKPINDYSRRNPTKTVENALPKFKHFIYVKKLQFFIVMAEENQKNDLELAEFGEDFSNQIEDFEKSEGETPAIDADFTEEKTVKPPSVSDKGAIFGAIVDDEFSAFLSSLPTDEVVTIVVWRLSDRNYTGQFRLPCEDSGHQDTIYWKAPKTSEEIYADIQKKHGGGLYQFKIRQGRGFAKGKVWNQLIRDPAEPSVAEKALMDALKPKTDEQVRNNQSSQVFANEKSPKPQSKMRELLNELKEFEELKNFFAPEAAPAPVVQNSPVPADDQIKLSVFKLAEGNPELSKQAFEFAFGKEESYWLKDLGMYAFQNPDQTEALLNVGKRFIGDLVGYLLPARPQSTTTAIMPSHPANNFNPAQQPGATSPSAFAQPPITAKTSEAALVAETQPAASEIAVEPIPKVIWED